MALGAIGLLVCSAAIHGIWNLLSKRSQDKQVFLWLALCILVAGGAIPFVLGYAPIPAGVWGLIGLSALCEAAYYLLLGGAYQHGDLSLVYPLARGTAILCVTGGAALALGEHVAGLGIAGIGLILGGIYILHLRGWTRHDLGAPLRALRARPSQLALLTGLTTAGYSMVDKVGVRDVPPLRYIYPVFVLLVLLLAPYMILARRAAIRREWQANHLAILAAGVMMGTAYGLVLFAMTGSPVSYVASVRELGVVFAALLGTLVLGEAFGAQKLAGAALIFAGIVCIGLAA